MRKIRKGDDVVIVAGKDKGKRGVVLRLTADNRVFVEGANMVKRHVKPNPMAEQPGGIVEKEAALHISNVMVFNPKTDKGDRVGIKTLDDGRKARFFKSNNENVDI
jgi:large subunit ribosomal protein L24